MDPRDQRAPGSPGGASPQEPTARPPLRPVEPPPLTHQQQADDLTIEGLRAALSESRAAAEMWRGIATQLHDNVIKPLQSSLGVAYAQHRDLLAAVSGLVQSVGQWQAAAQHAQQEGDDQVDQERLLQLLSGLKKRAESARQQQQGPRPPQSPQGGGSHGR